jgi:Uma2 family endonuclease
MLGDLTTTESEWDFAIAPPWPLRRFTVAQYQRLGQVGILMPEDRVELLEGWIVEKMNHGPLHGYMVRLLDHWLHESLPSDFLVQCQLPITTERSQLEPDLAVIRGIHEDFRTRHPFGHECRLVIEVADSSTKRDEAKVDIYRSGGVQEYWIFDIPGKSLHRYFFGGVGQTQDKAVFSANETFSIIIGNTELTLDLGRIFSNG